MYTVVWEFLPAPGQESAFERVYGPSGEWARLFGRARGFLGTECLPHPEAPGWYRTVDRWESEIAYLAFRSRFRGEYAALDSQCDGLSAVARHVVSDEA